MSFWLCINDGVVEELEDGWYLAIDWTAPSDAIT